MPQDPAPPTREGGLNRPDDPAAAALASQRRAMLRELESASKSQKMELHRLRMADLLRIRQAEKVDVVIRRVLGEERAVWAKIAETSDSMMEVFRAQGALACLERLKSQLASAEKLASTTEQS